ncbi:AI-2E family transporter [Actinoplanes sp. NPDC051851]|uniref:AI-2E family transporter n=1 Tax=Actinoplanes sp. NPDC051851 TaxID=3154753 RepID=UPI003447150E
MGPTLNADKTRNALRDAARVSWQTLLILAFVWVLLQLLRTAWSALWPLVIALLLTTLAYPAVRFLRRRGWPSALAAAVVLVLFLIVLSGMVVLIVVPVASQSTNLANGITDGIQQLRDWAAGPPLNITDDQLSTYLDEAVTKLKESVGSIATATLSGVSTVVSGLTTTLVALFLMFFFLKDGHRFPGWLSRQLPGRLAADIPEIAVRCWSTLGSFVRSQAFVGMLDAVFIGLGLWIVGVELWLPLAVLTFITAFIPIVGALLAGVVSVLIALVFNGWVKALIVLGIILLVQQLEGNVFQPMLQSRGLGLHAGVVLLAVTLGGSLSGIIGSLLAVPVAAMLAVIWNYIREQLTDPPPVVPPADPPAEVEAPESAEA